MRPVARDFCGLVTESAKAKLHEVHLFCQPAHKQNKEADQNRSASKTSHKHSAVVAVRILLSIVLHPASASKNPLPTGQTHWP
jgi:hypothetical protein